LISDGRLSNKSGVSSSDHGAKLYLCFCLQSVSAGEGDFAGHTLSGCRSHFQAVPGPAKSFMALYPIPDFPISPCLPPAMHPRKVIRKPAGLSIMGCGSEPNHGRQVEEGRSTGNDRCNFLIAIQCCLVVLPRDDRFGRISIIVKSERYLCGKDVSSNALILFSDQLFSAAALHLGRALITEFPIYLTQSRRIKSQKRSSKKNRNATSVGVELKVSDCSESLIPSDVTFSEIT
jgi:hypothetical protein